jgi:orotidine-5'-phosphate decarboxylase
MSMVSKLNDSIIKSKSYLCIGLDPHPNEMFVENVFDFNKQIIDVTHDLVAAYKPQFAFYEALGIFGLQALKETISYIRNVNPNIIIIGDAKRGDIGSTAKAYAHSLFEFWDVDIATVNPYMGMDTLLPYLEYNDRGIFVVCRTSNSGSGELQNLVVFDDEKKKLFEFVADLTFGISDGSNVGLVVGATYPEDVKIIREKHPQVPILIPGVGAQGGDLHACVKGAVDSMGKGFLINASRSIIFATKNPVDYPNITRKRALELRNAINESLQKLEGESV